VADRKFIFIFPLAKSDRVIVYYVIYRRKSIVVNRLSLAAEPM